MACHNRDKPKKNGVAGELFLARGKAHGWKQPAEAELNARRTRKGQEMNLSKNVLKAMVVIAFLACLGLPTASAEDDSTRASRPPAPPAGWTDGYVMANGIRIHYWRTGGNKPVLLMAHGSSDNGLCWTNLAKELVDDYDIILPDARGHGLSDPPRKSDSADAQAEDLAGLIRALKLKKPILMGHSMGSSSVAWFSAKYPDIPGAVILEDPRLIPRPSSNPSLIFQCCKRCSAREKACPDSGTEQHALRNACCPMSEEQSAMGTIRVRILGPVKEAPSSRHCVAKPKRAPGL